LWIHDVQKKEIFGFFVAVLVAVALLLLLLLTLIL